MPRASEHRGPASDHARALLSGDPWPIAGRAMPLLTDLLGIFAGSPAHARGDPRRLADGEASLPVPSVGRVRR